jgi:hypothetical protein
MRKLLLGLGIFVMLASVAAAEQIQVGVTSADPYGPYNAGQGGEFTLLPTGGNWLDLSGYAGVAINQGGIGTFQTFCLEKTEYIENLKKYDAVENEYADHGSTSTVDPLSVGTGWLYSQFATGSLAYHYNNPTLRRIDAAALQNAIWWLEGEMGLTNPLSNPYLLAANTFFGSLTNAKKDGAAQYGVYALNLTYKDRYGHTIKAQDQTYYHPVPVPEGGTTVLLLGIAFAGIGLVSFRFRN